MRCGSSRRSRKLQLWHDVILGLKGSGVSFREIARLLGDAGENVRWESIRDYLQRWGDKTSEGLGLVVQKQLKGVSILKGSLPINKNLSLQEVPTRIDLDPALIPSLIPRGFKVEGMGKELGIEMGDDPLGNGWRGYGSDKPWWEILGGVRGAGKRVEEYLEMKRNKKGVKWEGLEWEKLGWFDLQGALRWGQYNEMGDSEEGLIVREWFWELCKLVVMEYRVELGEKREVRFIIEGGRLGGVERERRDWLKMPRWWRREKEVEGWVLPTEVGWMKEGGGELETERFKRFKEEECVEEWEELTEDGLPDWYRARGVKEWVKGLAIRKVN